MGLLTDDMTRVRDEIDFLHNSREAFINDLKQNVVDIQANVAEMQADFRDSRAQMAQETKAQMEEFVFGVKRAVEGLRKDAVEMQDGFRRAHVDLAKRARADRRAFVSGLKEDVIKMQIDFRDAQARIKKNVKSELSTFISGVKEFVSDMKGTIQNLRNDFLADITGARKAWSGLAPTKRRGKKKEKEPERMGEEIRAREEVEDLVIDDLTIIQGIGQGIQQRLNDAGIHNLAQLARSTPEDLRRTLGKLGPIANVEKCIDQARKLAKLS